MQKRLLVVAAAAIVIAAVCVYVFAGDGLPGSSDESRAAPTAFPTYAPDDLFRAGATRSGTLPGRAISVAVVDVSPEATSQVRMTLRADIVNGGQDALVLDAGDFALLTQEGDAFGPASDQPLPAPGTVAPGASASIQIAFLVPEPASHGVALLYQPAHSGTSVILSLEPAPEPSPSG